MSEILLDYADKQRLAKEGEKLEELKELILNAYVVKSASGSVVSITDGADNVPVKSLIVDIIPKQSGTGDPSPDNVRPIEGWNGVNITVSPTLEAEDGTTYFISFPAAFGIVYGGTLDVTMGKLTVGWASVDLGSLDWAYDSNGFMKNTLMRSVILAPTAGTTLAEIKCSALTPKPSTTIYNGENGIGIHTNGDIRVRFEGMGTNPAIAKEEMDGFILCYKVVSPTVYDVTPTEVKTLLGVNNIWADCGNSTVEYRVDPSINSDNSNRANTETETDNTQTAENKTAEIDTSNKVDKSRQMEDKEDDVNE